MATTGLFDARAGKPWSMFEALRHSSSWWMTLNNVTTFLTQLLFSTSQRITETRNKLGR